jgi:hypothetical protein
VIGIELLTWQRCELPILASERRVVDATRVDFKTPIASVELCMKRNTSAVILCS